VASLACISPEAESAFVEAATIPVVLHLLRTSHSSAV